MVRSKFRSQASSRRGHDKVRWRSVRPSRTLMETKVLYNDTTLLLNATNVGELHVSSPLSFAIR